MFLLLSKAEADICINFATHAKGLWCLESGFVGSDFPICPGPHQLLQSSKTEYFISNSPVRIPFGTQGNWQSSLWSGEGHNLYCFIISLSKVMAPYSSGSPFAALNRGSSFLALCRSFVSTHLPFPWPVQASSLVWNTHWAPTGCWKGRSLVSGDWSSNLGLLPVFLLTLHCTLTYL